jgi:hypothetical protein
MNDKPRYEILPSHFAEVATEGRKQMARSAQIGRREVGPGGFVSPDGTVVFTPDELEALKKWCPSIRNMRRMIFSACRGWLRRVPPRQRKRVLVDWLIELEAKEWAEVMRSLDYDHG